MKQVFAHKGEQILNEDGTLYGTFTRNVERYELLNSDQVILPDGTNPNPTFPVPHCVFRFMLRREAELRFRDEASAQETV